MKVKMSLKLPSLDACQSHSVSVFPCKTYPDKNVYSPGLKKKEEEKKNVLSLVILVAPSEIRETDSRFPVRYICE